MKRNKTSKISTGTFLQPPAWLPQRDQWVKLLELPSDYSHDEALLLCQQSADQWVAWVPQHGEVVLHSHQFCSLN